MLLTKYKDNIQMLSICITDQNINFVDITAFTSSTLKLGPAQNKKNFEGIDRMQQAEYTGRMRVH